MNLLTSVRNSDLTRGGCKYSSVALASAVTYSIAKQRRKQVHEENQVVRLMFHLKTLRWAEYAARLVLTKTCICNAVTE